MSFFSIEIHDRVSSALRGLETSLADKQPMRETMGRAVVEAARNYYLAHPSNKAGFPSTGFWARAAGNVSFSVTSEGVQLSVDQVGINQRIYGGTITSKQAKYLTIPAIAAAYGHRASDFPDLQVFWGRRASSGQIGPIGLRARVAGGLAAPSAGGAVYFWFVQSVTQKPDPSAAPPLKQIQAAALEAADTYLTRLVNQEGKR